MGGGNSSVVEHRPCTREALNSIPAWVGRWVLEKMWRSRSLLDACSQCLECAPVVLSIAASKPWREPHVNQHLGSPTDLLPRCAKDFSRTDKSQAAPLWGLGDLLWLQSLGLANKEPVLSLSCCKGIRVENLPHPNLGAREQQLRQGQHS